jgi:DNA replication protein DnaC
MPRNDPRKSLAGGQEPRDPTLLERLEVHLNRLGLRHELERVKQHLKWAHEAKPDPLALVERCFGELAARKRERGIDRRITASGLKLRKTLATFEWPFQPKLDRSLVESLATLDFVHSREDVLLTGQTGTGKSHILQALALRACEQELTVKYARCVDLIDDLYAGLADGSYERRLRFWSRPVLLVIDDVGLGHLKKRDDEPTAAHMLYNLLDRRHMTVSTALSSNIKLSAWGRYLGDAHLASAVLDRLAMNSVRLDIDGPSYRQHIAKKRAQRKTPRRRKA